MRDLPKGTVRKLSICKHCGARFLRYGVMQYEECPHCGMPLGASDGKRVFGRSRVGIFSVAVGILVLLSSLALLLKGCK